MLGGKDGERYPMVVLNVSIVLRLLKFWYVRSNQFYFSNERKHVSAYFKQPVIIFPLGSKLLHRQCHVK